MTFAVAVRPNHQTLVNISLSSERRRSQNLTWASVAESVGIDSTGGDGQGWNSNIALKVFCPSSVALAGGSPEPLQAIRCAVAVTAWLTLKNFGTPLALAGHQSQRTV